jgi:hypothetical protein
MSGVPDMLASAKNSKIASGGPLRAGRDGGVIVSCLKRALPLVLAAVVLLTAIPGHAQSNLDAGKSAAQIFSDTCNACHRSPRELKQTSAGFLREHYTTGAREAATMAAYLASIGSDPSAVRQRKPPALGAGQAPATETAAKPPQPVPGGAGATEPAKPGETKPAETQAALPNANGRRGIEAREQAKDEAKPMVPTAAGRPRRPSDSIENGRLAAPASETPGQSAAAPAARPSSSEAFEE